MKTNNAIKQFIRRKKMKNRIITISREFGCGGRTIGKKVAEMLKIPCYDSELIEKMAQESGFHKEYIKDVNEDNSGGFPSFPAAPSGRTTRTIFGKFNAKSLRKSPKKVLASLWEDAPIISCGIKPTVCAYLFMPI